MTKPVDVVRLWCAVEGHCYFETGKFSEIDNNDDDSDHYLYVKDGEDEAQIQCSRQDLLDLAHKIITTFGPTVVGTTPYRG